MIKPAGVHESLGTSHVLFYNDYSACLLVAVGKFIVITPTHACSSHLLISAVRRGARSESTSAKVALMKMKMKAEGQDSIPQVCTVVPYLVTSCEKIFTKEMPS